jgi:hypothetical protein
MNAQKYAVIRTLLAVLTLLLTATAVHAAEWDIDQLMQDLAQIRSNRATFVVNKIHCHHRQTRRILR